MWGIHNVLGLWRPGIICFVLCHNVDFIVSDGKIKITRKLAAFPPSLCLSPDLSLLAFPPSSQRFGAAASTGRNHRRKALCQLGRARLRSPQTPLSMAKHMRSLVLFSITGQVSRCAGHLYLQRLGLMETFHLHTSLSGQHHPGSVQRQKGWTNMGRSFAHGPPEGTVAHDQLWH